MAKQSPIVKTYPKRRDAALLARIISWQQVERSLAINANILSRDMPRMNSKIGEA